MNDLKLILLFCGLVTAQFLAGSVLSGTWYSESSASTGVTNVSDSDTVTLTNTSGVAARIGAVASLSETVSLDEVGDFIQFIGDYSGQIGNNVNYSIRIGFYNSDGLTIDADFDSEMDSLVGFWGGVATRSSTGARNGVFFQNDTAQVMRLNEASPSTGLIGSFFTDVITTGNRTITYRIERIVADLLEFTLSDGANLNMSRTLAVASAPTLSLNAVAVGFVLADGNSATLDNIAVTAVPEPATVALLLGMGALGLVIARGRRQAAG